MFFGIHLPGTVEAVADLQHRNIHVAIASITWKFAIAWFAGKLNPVRVALGTEHFGHQAPVVSMFGVTCKAPWLLQIGYR